MKKVFLSFVLACIAVAANAQISQTPIKTFDAEENDDYSFFSRFFTYANGDQVFLFYGRDNVKIYDLSFNLIKTVNMATIPGYENWGILCKEFIYDEYSIASSDKFTGDNTLGFIVVTTDGFAIINENGQETFRKTYTDGWSSGDLFYIHETKNGNLLRVSLNKTIIPGEEYAYKIEFYALPGYTAGANLRSTSIEQLSNPYPNPAKTYIRLPYTLPQGVLNGTIRVFDTQGKMIKTFPVTGATEYVRLDTSNLPAGNYVYTLDIRGQKGESKRFIVK